MKCIICHQTSKKIGKHPDFETYIHYCFNCSYGFSKIDDEYLKEYYKEAFRFARNEFFNEDYLKLMKKRALNQMYFIKANCDLSKIKSVLDIGCSTGNLLDLFAAEKFGIEADVNAKKKCNLKKIKIINDFYSPNTIQRFFDLCILSHSFEHLNNIYDCLEDLVRITGSGGGVFIEVPYNDYDFIKSIIKNKMKTGHLHFFTAKSLKLFLEKHNRLEVKTITRCGPNRRFYSPQFGLGYSDFNFINKILFAFYQFFNINLNKYQYFNDDNSHVNGMFVRAFLKRSEYEK